MDKLLMCRICLVEDVKMYPLVSVDLQELYERLTEMSFITKTKKPVQVCYLCCARLQNCHRLQATCLRSEEFFNNIMANIELKQIELQDLNTLTMVHPLTVISCVPSTTTSDEDNDIKFDPLEITSNAQVKVETLEDDSFINEAVDVKSEATVEGEDIYTDNDDMSDNSHTMQDTQLQHDIQLKTVKIVLERIDLEQFKIGSSAANNTKIDLLNGNTKSTISVKPETGMTIIQNKNNEEKLQTIERVVVGENKNIVKQISFIDEVKKKKNMELFNDVHGKVNTNRCKVRKNNVTHKSALVSRTCKHTGKQPYSCDICENSFIRKTGLITQILTRNSMRPYICNVCGKCFTQKDSLVTHIRIHTGERSYRCNICGKSFTLKSILVTHIRTHTGEGSYRCITCNQSFTWKSHLIAHTRIHAGERYICNVCGKRFAQKDTLVRHNGIHSDERPYRCDVCGKSFNWKRDLVRHIHIHIKATKVCYVRNTFTLVHQ